MENLAARVSARAGHMIAFAAITMVAACSEQGTGDRQATPSTAAAAIAEPSASELPPASGDTLEAKMTAAGIPTVYRARFDKGQLTSISERRGAGQAGEYQFYGARVTRYVGAPLDEGPDIDIEFDLRGTVVSARPVSGAGAQIPAEEVSAISSRGQLLRSHAVTQRSVKEHRPH